MAISSINHKTIGKKTHPPRTASAHLRYVLRASACNEVLAANIPMPTIGSRGGEAKKWLEQYEDTSRSNARIIDKLMIALPIELSQQQRVDLLYAYVDEITGGEEIAWLAALHDQDSHNPHVHMIFWDKGVQTGKRVVEFSENGSTQKLRTRWQKICNEHLAKAGIDARIDVRSLKVQRAELLAKAEGTKDPDERQKLLDAAEELNRRPSGHEGPEPHAIEANGGVSTKLDRLHKVRNEDNAWESYNSESEFLRYPSADAVGDLIVDILDQPEPQPIAEEDQTASDWWDLFFQHEAFYSGYIVLLAASLKTFDMTSLLAEADKLFEDFNTHPDHPLMKEFDHLALLGQNTLKGGWRAFPKLAAAMRTYAIELGPLPSAATVDITLDPDVQPSETDTADLPQSVQGQSDISPLSLTDEALEGPDSQNNHHTAPEGQQEAAGGHTEPHSGPEAIQDAFEVDQLRVDAAKALSAAKSDLSRAKQNLRNAQDILDGKYDLITGERIATGNKTPFLLRSSPETSGEDGRDEEHMAMWYDEDGDEMFPHQRPVLSDYNDLRNDQEVFDEHFAQWLARETARITRAEKNKRKIWETEFAEKRDQLRAINKLDVGQIIGEVLKLARSIFDWLRERVILARNLLGEKHDLTRQMKADWGDTLAENKKAHDLVAMDHKDQEREAFTEARPIWDQGKQSWAEVELKREKHKASKQVLPRPSFNDGPKM